MYHYIVRRRLREIFRRLSDGDYEYALAQLAPQFEHTFAGDHCLGGTRRTAAGFRRWFERLYRLFPNLRFEVHQVNVSGWPYDTVALVEWIDRAEPADGQPYVNAGAHVIRLRFGRVVKVHAYLDTHVLVETCRRLAQHGIQEAAAAPIGD